MTEGLTAPSQLALVDDPRVRAILSAADTVMARFGPDALSLTHIARVSLIPLARIYQFFPDRNAVLGALSSRALARMPAAIGRGGEPRPGRDAGERLDRVIDLAAGYLGDRATAYLVLCGPFDRESTALRLEATHRLGVALQRAAAQDGERDSPTRDHFDYAGELAFACFHRAYLVESRVTAESVAMAQRAVRAFILAS